MENKEQKTPEKNVKNEPVRSLKNILGDIKDGSDFEKILAEQLKNLKF